jgi:hypothetical protein
MQLAVSLAGAAIGSFFGPVGAQIGFALGSALGASLGPGTQGPRLADKRIQISSYGAALGLCFGGARQAGSALWAADLREVESEEGGKGSPSVTSFSYFGSFAVGIDGRPHSAIRRIWADGKLIYNTAEGASDDEREQTYRLQQLMTFYSGSETQLPDPTIESYEGVGQVEAYRGVCYVVFSELPLDRFGNRIPNLEFEMGGDEAEACIPPDVPTIGVAPADAPSQRTLILSWAPVTGATSYEAYRVNPDSTVDELVVFLDGGTWKAQSVVNGGQWPPGQEFLHYVLAVNACGSSQSNIRRALWFGQIGGNGEFYATTPQQICATEHWPEPYTGYGAAFWGAICYGALGGTYAGLQAGTDLVYSDLGDFEGAAGDPLAGIVDPSSMLLSEIVEEICAAAGLTALDVTALDDVVLGYRVPRQMPARDAIEPLRQAFHFDLVEIETQVVAIRRGGDAVFAITADELGVTESGEPMPLVEPEREQEAALPAEVSVAYDVREADYATGMQQSRRVTTGSRQVVSLELPMVLTDEKAAQVADVLMYDAWAGRTQRKFTTSKRHTRLTPGDVGTVSDGEFTYRVMLLSKLENGPLIEWTARDEEQAAYDPNSAFEVTPGGGGTVVNYGPLQVDLIDLPAARDADYASPGFYAAAHGSSFVGGVLYRSPDGAGSYSALQTINVAATYGTASSVLGAYAGGNTVDEQGSVIVQMERGTLATITRAALLSMGNYALLGEEYICFRTATLLSANTWRLSGLLRGLRGSVNAMGTHAVGERFVLLSESNVYRIEQELAELVPAQFKAVGYGRTLGDTTAQDFTNTGGALKPLPVAHLAAVDIGGGEFKVKWVRRGRYAHTWRDGVDVPLGEDVEAYVVEVFDGGVLTESQTVSVAYATVTAAAGDVVVVQQLSATVGRGYAAELTL